IEVRGNEMYIRVDQTRHEHLALAVNDLCLRRCERALRDFTNSLPLHQDMHVLADPRATCRSKGYNILSQCSSWSSLPSREQNDAFCSRLLWLNLTPMIDLRGEIVGEAWADYKHPMHPAGQRAIST